MTPTTSTSDPSPMDESDDTSRSSASGFFRSAGTHPPLVGERETTTPELFPTFTKAFRVGYNPTGALHTKKQGRNNYKAKIEQLGTESRTTRKRQEDLRLWSATSSSASSGTRGRGSALTSCGQPGSRLLPRKPFGFAPGSGPDDPSTQSRGTPCPKSAAPTVY